MPKFDVRVSQRVFYDVEVEAETFAAARGKVEAVLIAGDDLEEELGMSEVDNSDYRIERIQTDENGDLIEGE